MSLRSDYECSPKTLTELAEQYNNTPARIHIMATQFGWQRLHPHADKSPMGKLSAVAKQPPAAKEAKAKTPKAAPPMAADPVETSRVMTAGRPRQGPQTEAAAVVAHAVAIVARLADELDVTTSYREEILADIEEVTKGDKDNARRYRMTQAISLSARTLIAKNLASAVKLMTETVTSATGAGVGSKKAAVAAAALAAATDEFATPPPPKLIVNNDTW